MCAQVASCCAWEALPPLTDAPSLLRPDSSQKSSTCHSAHTVGDQSGAQADQAPGVMRLYRKDLAKQCGIGCAKSGFQLSGVLKRRFKKKKQKTV